jgi:deoxyribose-phosphate aldolase
MWTKQTVARTLDYSVIKPQMTDRDIVEACGIAKKYSVAALVVRQTDIPLAVKELEGSGVKVATAIGFPFGYNFPASKADEARYSIEAGAEELDMVINIGELLSGDYDLVSEDIEGVVRVAKKRNALVKVVFEICYLPDEKIVKACELSRDAGADFVKTSTGFGPGAATPHAVALMVKTVGKVMGVKAAGGIKDWNTAVAYLDLGCTRLGIGAAAEILEGAPQETPREEALREGSGVLA